MKSANLSTIVNSFVVNSGNLRQINCRLTNISQSVGGPSFAVAACGSDKPAADLEHTGDIGKLVAELKEQMHTCRAIRRRVGAIARQTGQSRFEETDPGDGFVAEIEDLDFGVLNFDFVNLASIYTTHVLDLLRSSRIHLMGIRTFLVGNVPVDKREQPDYSENDGILATLAATSEEISIEHELIESYVCSLENLLDVDTGEGEPEYDGGRLSINDFPTK